MNWAQWWKTKKRSCSSRSTGSKATVGNRNTTSQVTRAISAKATFSKHNQQMIIATHGRSVQSLRTPFLPLIYTRILIHSEFFHYCWIFLLLQHQIFPGNSSAYRRNAEKFCRIALPSHTAGSSSSLFPVLVHSYT